MDIDRLKLCIKESPNKVDAIAKECGFNKTTLYRKLESGKITVSDAMALKRAIPLTKKDAIDIFFTD